MALTYGGTLRRLRKTLEKADCVLVGAGAGLSTSAGLTYGGERFDRHFSDFKKTYGIQDMYTGAFYPFETDRERWAFLSRVVWHNRYIDPPRDTYRKVLDLVSDKDFFVITTNVDHCFQKAGIDRDRLFYTQGDYGLFQCSLPCHDETYDNHETIRQMVEEQEQMRVPDRLMPTCPVCGRAMALNLRGDDSFVEDAGWHAAAGRYQAWLEEHVAKRIVYLELGVGANTPVIIKYPMWRLTAANEDSTYVCINLGEAVAPREIRDRTILIDADIDQVLTDLLG